jgi:glutaconyl-CoA/methylmalonyl-CoA decarboxylase subunit delta
MILNNIILQVHALGSAQNHSSDLKMDMAGLGELSFGVELLITGIFVLAMLWLYHTFFIKPRMSVKQPELKNKRDSEKNTLSGQKVNEEISDEISAAIGLALHLYKQQLSDYEKARLTIARVSRTYSPWSSKIYGLRQNPRR